MTTVETALGATKTMVLNMGPQHPSTHGVLRVALELDGETVVKAVPDLGYLHTGIEKECEVKTWQQLNDFYEKAVALYKRQFGVLQLIVLVMVVLSVANSINMSVFERIGEFGTMMALGNRGAKVFRLVVIESALLGSIGAALGAAFGVALALGISAIGIPMPPPPNGNLGYIATIRIVPSVIAMAFTVGFVATTLAALLPAYRVSRTAVADALRANV